MNHNQNSKSKKELGKKGEMLALNFLKKNNLELIEQNFTIWGGEIDIIMKDNIEYVFVEVKTRTSKDIDLRQLITFKQKSSLINTAKYWLESQEKEEVDWRIDVVGILMKDSRNTEIEWIQNAVY
ncbi:YraN family protein [Candidatus Dojkabacteria bacterium]|nr:YraN family protein [Candidatus Dojkabacteria bacterium]